MNTTLIPDIIIDEHLTRANPDFIAVFLYVSRWRKDNTTIGSVSKKAADALGLSKKNVTDALLYWAEAGFDLADRHSDKEKAETIRIETRPSYNAGDIEKAAAKTDDVRYMFKMAERIFGKALTYNDMNLLMGFYDWLALPVPVIEVLLDYCVSNNKRNSRYLEKVAINWADSGITTVDEAEAYIKTFNGDYREILKALGHTKRDPTTKEIAYMRKWLRDLGFSLELVVEACGRTVLQTGGTSFTYVDRILKNWHEKYITTIEQANADEQEFRQNRESQKPVPKTRPTTLKKSRFADYKGRDCDFEEMNRLIMAKYTEDAEG
jgi:DnaD/phage-associated family protein